MKLQFLLLACVIATAQGSGKSIGNSGYTGRVAGAGGGAGTGGYQASYGHQSALGQQYFTSSNDGSYDFGYNTGTGAYQKETKRGNQVTGNYGSSGPDGSYVNVEYQAVNTGDDNDGAGYGSSAYRSSSYSTGGATGGATSGGQGRFTSNVRYGGGAASAGYTSGGGGAAGQAGQYVPGAKIAPGAVSAGAPAYTSPVTAGGYSGAAGGYSGGAGGYTGGAGGYTGAAGASQRYSTSARQQAYGSGRPVEFAQFNLERKGDGSYSYNYQSSDGAKTETKTSDGQVQGSYSYPGDDGVQRTVAYSAGEQGFLASGDHLPRTDDGVPAAGTNEGAAVVAATKEAYNRAGGDRGAYGSAGFDSGLQTGRTASGYNSQTRYGGGAAFRPSFGAYSAPGSGGKAYQQTGRSSAGAGAYDSGAYASNEAPKPFAFSYNTGAQSRQESQDAAGVVRGEYTVNSPDGTQKQLVYQADDDGFHIIEEKQIEGGGSGASYSAGSGSTYAAGSGTTYTTGGAGGAGGALAPTAGAGFASGRSAAAAGGAYKPKSIHSGALYR